MRLGVRGYERKCQRLEVGNDIDVLRSARVEPLNYG